MVTLLELSLIPAKPYVELTYYPVSSGREAVAKIQEIVKKNNSYVDGILFSKDRGVVCVGRLTPVPENSETKVQRFTRAHDPWFYLHAEDLIERRNAPQQETIPIVDYLFRYDRGGFWVGRFAFRYFLVPFNFFTRWFLDDFLHTRMPYENQTCGWFPRSGGGFSLTKCEDFPPAKIPPNFGGKMKQKVPPFLRGFWNGDC